MSDPKKIIWLASYPKSGNTWFRAFLANLLKSAQTPVDINNLQSLPIASSRQLFDEIAGVSSSDLSPEELEEMRPQVYEYLSAEAKENIYIKIHDAFIYTPGGKLIVSEKASYRALYFIRNPLDVSVSFAHHAGMGFDQIIEIMNNDDYAFCNSSEKLNNQIQQRLLTWSSHVASWTEQKVFPLKVLRYEDMLTNTFVTFKEAVQFLQLNFTDEEINKALQHSSFEELQKQESEKGFREKAPASKLFFRKGKIGSWHEELNPNQAEMIISQHAGMMKKFGYLNEKGRPVY